MSERLERQQTKRLFSLQLADHDHLFSPQRKVRRSFSRLRTFLFFIPPLITLTFPSFQLGQAVWEDPGIELPNTLKVGNLFTIPVKDQTDAKAFIPLVSGRALGFVDGKEPMYIGTAMSSFDFEVSLDFKKHDPYARLKGLIPKPEHPTYPLFVKRIDVISEPAPTEIEEAAKTTRKEIEKIIPPPPIEAQEAAAYERHDGNMRLRCWRAPSIEPLGIDPLKPRRNPRLGSLSAVGPGEVVYSSPSSVAEKIIVLYHGGGLFSRYWGVRELRLPRNGRVITGQVIGNVHLAPARQVTKPHWQPLIGGVGGPGKVNPSVILDLSSRLCDSK